MTKNRLDIIIAAALDNASPDQQLWAGIQLKRWELTGLLWQWVEPVAMAIIPLGTLAVLAIPRLNEHLTSNYQLIIAGTIPTGKPLQTETVFPIPGMTLETAPVSSDYGPREIFGQKSMHHGVDIAAPIGTPVIAPEAGVITRVWEQPEGGGKVVELVPDSAKGKTLKFLHLDEQSVAEGNRVEQGTVIARVGSTGKSTGPHLDFRIKVGSEWEDPRGYLKAGKAAPKPKGDS